MREKLLLVLMSLCLAAPAMAQLSVGIGPPTVSVGINQHSYPKLVPVPQRTVGESDP
jgi:hypothetical protein